MKKLAIAGAFAAAAGALAAPACLPGDTRPVPAVIHFQVEPSGAVTGGVTTADGWTITFERLLVTLGNAGIEGDACNSYANARYQRLFDFTVPGTQKLGDVYGLGSCDARVRLRAPGSDALLGEGVTAEDLAMMRAGGTDAWALEESRTSVFARGKAARGGVEKRFEWTFRFAFNLHACPRPGDAGLTTKLALETGEDVSMTITLRGEELFRESLDEGAGLRFDTMAEADTDGDQRITLDELSKVPGPELPPDAGPPLGPSDGGQPSFADFVYMTLLPSMIRLAGSDACLADTRFGPGQ